MRYAASKGIAIVVMEPLLGWKSGEPACANPGALEQRGNAANACGLGLTMGLESSWEVAVALSGMSTFNQTVENVESAERSVSGVFTEAELRLYQARKKYQTLQPIPCTGCGYCLPCPQGVAIPVNFDNYNKGFMYDNAAGARGEYTGWLRRIAGNCSC